MALADTIASARKILANNLFSTDQRISLEMTAFPETNVTRLNDGTVLVRFPTIDDSGSNTIAVFEIKRKQGGGRSLNFYLNKYTYKETGLDGTVDNPYRWDAINARSNPPPGAEPAPSQPI